MNREWKVIYYLGEKATLRSKAQFGSLTFEPDQILISGNPALRFSREEVQEVAIVTVPIAVSAVRIKTNRIKIIIAHEWFHITRHVIFAWFQGDLRRALLAHLKR